MKHRSMSFVLVLTTLVMLFGPAVGVYARPLFQPSCVVPGFAYRDFNADGTRGSEEPGVAGINVRAFDAAGNVYPPGAPATTDDTGAYTLSGLPDNEEVRLEFSNLPSYLRYGPAGTESLTGVTFVTCASNGGADVDIALANPGQHCGLNPDIVTTCFAFGDQTGTNATVMEVPYNAGSTDLAPPSSGRFDNPSPSTLAVSQEVGSVWGVAYRRQTGLLYTGAFLKRHTGFGPDGPGAIYVLDPNVPNSASPFTTLTAAGASETLHDVTNYTVDTEAYNLVGKRGLGDMTISDDDSTLYVVNLYDRSLYDIDLDNSANISSVPIPTSDCANSADARPFAVEFHDGLVYVGVTCTAESSQQLGQLEAFVYSHVPGTAGFTQVLNFPLDSTNYPRLCANDAGDANCGTNAPANWNPWILADDPPIFPLTYNVGDSNVFPQPWLSDIEFDNNGDMILGIRDRWGDMSGNYTPSPVPGAPGTLYNGISAGDILRACISGPNSWTLETNASCGGGPPTGGAGNGGGPGSGEYYYQENLTDYHDELSQGSALQVPGQTTVVATMFDTVPINTELFNAGFRWFDNSSGQDVQAYRIYPSGDPVRFGKANGLGGMEALCPPAPIEIGNRVWFDLDNDGVQDAGEGPVAGVTVNLYDGSGNLIATTTTDANGNYIFTGLDPNTNYVLRMDNPADYAAGGPLEGWFVTAPNSDQDQRDSDALLTNSFPQIAVTTGNFGENDHTLDFGFSNVEPPASIQLVKSVDNPQAQAGDTVVYTYVVTNTGPVTIVIDQLVDDRLGVITVTPTTLLPGESATGTSQPVTLQAGDLPLTNIATVTGHREDNNEPLTDTDTVTVGGSPGGEPGGGGNSPSIQKSVNPPVAQVGDTVTWTITVNNPTDQTMNNVSVSDTIPNGLQIVSVAASAGNVSYSGQQVTFIISALGPNQSVTITVRTRIVDAATLIFDNVAVLADPNLTATARLIIASELAGTGESPWWRTPLIAVSAGMLVLGGGYALRRRRPALHR